jgi:capsular polysaccharide transport system permease protein
MALQADEYGFHQNRVSLLKSAAIQSRTMSALAVRFMMTRYGRENIGFLWFVIEPMILCVGVMAVWSLLKGGYEHGVQIISLVFTGYMPLTLQRHISSSGIYVIRSSKSTLVHRNITYLDNLLSKFFMEFIATTMAAIFIYTVLVYTSIMDSANDLSAVINGWLMMGCIALGYGCILAGLSEISEATEKFIPAFNYITVPLSGCFFMIDWLPTKLHDLVFYVPLIHAYEAIRAGVFGPSIVTHYSNLYGFGSALVMMCIGLIIIEYVRDRV